MLSVAFLVLVLAPPVTYVPFANARYNFSVDRPTFLTPQRPPDNGDGQEFRAGEIVMRAYGEMNTDGSTAESVLKSFLKIAKDGKVSLGVATNGWYALSYSKDGIVHYDKSFVGRDTMRTIEFEYPIAQQARMGPVVTHVVRSFRPG